jgi:uncharacterized protein (UPF0332 family)
MAQKSPEALMLKARQATLSAQALLDLGDADGASNRAYYAMFDAAQAALLVAVQGPSDSVGKMHRGLIQAFSAHLVKDGPVSKDLGRQLKRAEEVRLMADYNGESVDMATAVDLVARSRAFVKAMQMIFFAGTDESDGIEA